MDTSNFPSVSKAVCLKFWTGWAACDFIDMARDLLAMTSCSKFRGQSGLDGVTFIFVSGPEAKAAEELYRRHRFSERGVPEGKNFFIEEPSGPAFDLSNVKPFRFSGTLSSEDWEREVNPPAPGPSELFARHVDSLFSAVFPTAA